MYLLACMVIAYGVIMYVFLTFNAASKEEPAGMVPQFK
jgi:hypothetical protein